jgi:hypothetical protein
MILAAAVKQMKHLLGFFYPQMSPDQYRIGKPIWECRLSGVADEEFIVQGSQS